MEGKARLREEALPKSLRPWASIIEDFEDDRGNENGYWVHLRDGWVCDESAAPHTIHEDTIRLCVRCLRHVRRDAAEVSSAY